MKTIYLLMHRIVQYDCHNKEEIRDTKLLGFFSSKKLCLEAIEFYCSIEGFKDYPDSFLIQRNRIDVNDFNNISNHYNKKVYNLTHEWYDGEYDYISDLGCYSTYENAKIAQSLYETEDEYKDHVDGFCIDEYDVNQKHWLYGF